MFCIILIEGKSHCHGGCLFEVAYSFSKFFNNLLMNCVTLRAYDYDTSNPSSQKPYNSEKIRLLTTLIPKACYCEQKCRTLLLEIDVTLYGPSIWEFDKRFNFKVSHSLIKQNYSHVPHKDKKTFYKIK